MTAAAHEVIRRRVLVLGDAGAVGVVVAGEEGGAARVAGGEVGQPVVPAHRLHVVHVAGAPEVARGRQVHLQTNLLLILDNLSCFGSNQQWMN